MSEEVTELSIRLTGDASEQVAAYLAAEKAGVSAAEAAAAAGKAGTDAASSISSSSKDMAKSAMTAEEAHAKMAKGIKGAAAGAAKGVAALAVGGIGALVAILPGAINASAEFGTTMRQIAVATGAPASALEDLRALAMKMGADTVFSAQDAGAAMLELARSGMTVADLKAGALASTLTLASAGELALADAAGFVVQGLSTFNLKANQSAAVAAALAGAANASTASVESIGQALSAVGPGAYQAGLSIQETVGVLAAFDKAGLKGSDAGTSLKTMLNALTPTTDKARETLKKLGLEFVNADGTFKNIVDIAGQLERQMGKLSPSVRSAALETIFGTDAQRAAAIATQLGSEKLREYIRAAHDKEAADRAAAATTSGTAGALSRLSGSIDTAKLALGDALAPAVDYIADRMGAWTNKVTTDVIPAVAGFVKGMQDGTGPGGQFAGVLEGIGGALSAMASVVGPTLGFIGDHPDLFTTVAIGAAALAVALKAQAAALVVIAAVGPKAAVAAGTAAAVGTGAAVGAGAAAGAAAAGGAAAGAASRRPPLIAGPTIPLTVTLVAGVETFRDIQRTKGLVKDAISLEQAADAAKTRKEIQLTIQRAEAVMKKAKTVDLGDGKRTLVDPSVDANLRAQGAKAVEVRRELQRRLNRAAFEQDRLDDPKASAASIASARRTSDAIKEITMSASRTAGAALHRNVGTPIKSAAADSDRLLQTMLMLPDRKRITVDIITREILPGGGFAGSKQFDEDTAPPRRKVTPAPAPRPVVPKRASSVGAPSSQVNITFGQVIGTSARDLAKELQPYVESALVLGSRRGTGGAVI